MDEHERIKQERIERGEKAVSALMRLGVSLTLPAWGLATLILGIVWRSGWWIGTGVAIGAIGILFLAGSSLSDPFLRRQ